MQQIVIDNPELVRRIEDRARERGVSVEDFLFDAVPAAVILPPPDLPDATTFSAQHGLDSIVAEEIAREARMREWTAEMIEAEIIWQQVARDNPDADRRKLPGFVEHIMRINHWPKTIRDSFKGIAEVEDAMYDEYGLLG